MRSIPRCCEISSRGHRRNALGNRVRREYRSKKRKAADCLRPYRSMRFTGTTVLRFKDGMIVEEIGLDDGVTALQQLGLIKPA